MKNKKAIFLGLAIVCVVALLFLISRTNINYSEKSDNQKQKTQIQETSNIFVIQTIELKNDVENKQAGEKIEIKRGSSALDLLADTVEYKSEGEGKNAYITRIKDVTADPQRREFWAFYVNGKQSQVGAGSYILKNNDEILWKIENY